ncbi:ribokinase [Alkaliflexus imshenetskii]|uniref:ribokinase n=1 Tax=Alkaliflexus imshenetskii TaxID=286730 RepID=UPI00047CACCC|nr:ribokinase [Alkaliflexus imshenetskii]
MKPKITVIGSSNTDMICRVRSIPRPGETILGNDFLIVQGGKGANQAVAAARAGGDVTFITCVGNDAFGQQAIEAYQKDGINTSCIQKIDGTSTGVALINVADSGENSIAVAPGANAHLTPEKMEEFRDVILSSEIVLMQLEIPLETVNYVTRLANQANIPVVLNPAPARIIDKEIMSMLTLITPNEHEAKLISGHLSFACSEMESASEIQNQGVESVIVTMGSKGAYFIDGISHGMVKGIKVQAVDTTGAGDTFNGYLVVEWAKNKNLPEAIKKANKAAAISVTRMGAQPSIPYANELAEF